MAHGLCETALIYKAQLALCYFKTISVKCHIKTISFKRCIETIDFPVININLSHFRQHIWLTDFIKEKQPV